MLQIKGLQGPRAAKKQQCRGSQEEEPGSQSCKGAGALSLNEQHSKGANRSVLLVGEWLVEKTLHTIYSEHPVCPELRVGAQTWTLS